MVTCTCSLAHVPLASHPFTTLARPCTPVPPHSSVRAVYVCPYPLYLINWLQCIVYMTIITRPVPSRPPAPGTRATRTLGPGGAATGTGAGRGGGGGEHMAADAMRVDNTRYVRSDYLFLIELVRRQQQYRGQLAEYDSAYCHHHYHHHRRHRHHYHHHRRHHYHIHYRHHCPHDCRGTGDRVPTAFR